ncbi:MAG: c-type cytochrome [Bryobacteraceae bacterium]|nr:c-type cytochrome [Bryobacterales bacterium]NUN03869.1 c-type cytochrome [Bryobacteraceae bacterium]
MEDERQDASPLTDPIAGHSLSAPILIASVLLFVSLVWALYDELLGQRPWKGYQRQFVQLYSSYLKKLGPRQAQAEGVVYNSREYRALEQRLTAAEEAVAPRVREIETELTGIRQQLESIRIPFQDARAKVAALTYQLEHASAGRKESIRREIREARKGPFRLELASSVGKSPAQPQALDFNKLEAIFNGLKGREAQLNAEQAEITRESRELRRLRAEYLSDHLAGVSQTQIDALIRKMDTFRYEIKQIHVEEAGLIDRCQSCHLGILEPVALSAADMGGQRAFVSHPNKPLLALHDPVRFGCTPCHNGNGLATASVEDGHGNYKHWLWPLFAKENSEAGCLQCHFHDRVLEYAPTLTRGRDLYELKGCIGCHRYEGFDRESDALSNNYKTIQALEQQQKEARLEADREIKAGDLAESNEAARRHYARAESLRVRTSNMDARLAELNQQSRFLMQDQKMTGPNLKDVRLKLRKEWIPVWLKDPQAFRPGTKMPRFRLSEEEIRALSAFVWQSALEGPKPEMQAKGDPAAGKELFETRGCMGCHSLGEGENRIGGEFAGNLSRLGEKANYDYIVRWIHNPRDRTRPYCPHEKRDLGPEDYTRHGLPYKFGLHNSKCPNDGHEVQVQNMTVMPSLRLSWQQARDIAMYLTNLKHDGAAYSQDVSYMDDPKLAARGQMLMSRYGCASCHEVRGLEDAPRIGTELTKESSKPMEQLDFGLLEHRAKRENWYSHKGFYEAKLRDPAFFDQGREKAPEERLRMPNIQLTADDRRALTTFLLGSMDSAFRAQFRTIPEQFRYIPTDQQKDIQEGWWLIKKYNCMGCHNIQIGQKSILSGLPRYQDPDWKEQLPPTLVQQGARVDPEWLTRFLADPSLGNTDSTRNGVRTYLHARMPTFSFSPNEIQKLVRFFLAAAGQSSPYIPSRLEPLDDKERQMARTLFSSQAAPCLKCHLVGDPGHDRFATAPNFLIAKERLKPDWTARWLTDPQSISPGTAMPSGLFRREGERWVFAGPVPAAFKEYSKDHIELLVRYMFQLTPDEQRRLIQTMPKAAPAAATREVAARTAGSR